MLALTASISLAEERPRPENYPDYAKYIQALFDYERALAAAPKEEKSDDSASKLCRDDGAGEEEKKNSCEGKELIGENRIPEKDQHESRDKIVADEPIVEDLDEAIAKAQVQMPGLVANSAGTRSTFSSFPLEEAPALDLGELGVTGLLGMFNLGSGGLQGLPGTSSRLRPDSPVGVDEDGELRFSLDDYMFTLTNLDEFLIGLAGFGDVYTVFSTDVRVSDSGLEMSISSETRISNLYLVDRDGVPGTPYDNAGAIMIDRLAILAPRLEVTIQGVRDSNDNGVLEIGVSSPKPITVDLTNTRVGTADAVRDGSRIGRTTDFLVFGPNSYLTVAAGTNVTAAIASPTSDQAFVTLNGRVGEITLEDISLLARGYTAINIGRLTLRNINLVNTRFWVEDDEVTIDAGTGLTSLTVGLERIRLGSGAAAGYIGDFYLEDTRVHKLRMTAIPH
jgi:hypothetical protein